MTITIATANETMYHENHIDDFSDWVDWDKIYDWCYDRDIKVEVSVSGLFGKGEYDYDGLVWGRGACVCADNEYEDIREALRDVERLRDQLVEKADIAVGKEFSQED